MKMERIKWVKWSQKTAKSREYFTNEFLKHIQTTDSIMSTRGYKELCQEVLDTRAEIDMLIPMMIDLEGERDFWASKMQWEQKLLKKECEIVDTLRAELDSLKRQYDNYVQLAGREDLFGDVIRLEAEIARLREALGHIFYYSTEATASHDWFYEKEVKRMKKIAEEALK
jgi:hypothetical protein